MTKYRKSVKKSEAVQSETVTEKAEGKKVDKVEKSVYNPETWTEQFFREKREREEVQKDERNSSAKAETATGTTGQENGKGIPAEKGIPGAEV